jgi:3'(2'), 5'-bisphosphate nucleotidase
VGDYRNLHDWDVCAGHLLVVEAGGHVGGLDGTPILYDGSGSSLRGRGLLASNGQVHEAALAASAAAGLVPS